VAEVPRGTAAAVRRLASADRLPADGRGFVNYVGGKEAAWKALSGLEGKPQRGEYSGRNAGERFQADTTKWRNAQRWVQRHTAEEGKQQRGQGERARPVTSTLEPKQRRRAQTVNRERKREEVRREGINVTLTGTFTSPNRADRGGRTRTIGKYTPVHIPADVAEEILDALASGDREGAEELLWAAFLDALGIPEEYLDVSGGSWTVAAA
jgi:hypothetical protein